MHLTIVSFNFNSADLAAADAHYLSYHVGLARTYPGLRMYLTGKLLEMGGVKPDRYRIAIMGFDSVGASASAMSSEAGPKLMTDSIENLTDLGLLTCDCEVVVPFEPRRADQPCFLFAAAFDFRPEAGDAATAERVYRAGHVEVARKLPGLRSYLVGPLTLPGGSAADRQRIALLAFDTRDAFRKAMTSPAAAALAGDTETLIANVSPWHAVGRVEV